MRKHRSAALRPRSPSAKGFLTFTAAQKADKEKTTAPTPQEAINHVSAIGELGSNIAVEKLGGEAPNIKWEVTWGTDALVVKQA